LPERGGIKMVNIKKQVLVGLIIATLSITTACTTKTSYSGSNNIAESSEIAQVIKSDDNFIVLDVRSEEKYLKGHLEGSVHLNTGDLLTNEPVKAMMASPEKIADVIGAKGISNDTTIYIYDDNKGVYASRVWWTLKNIGHERVEIINNGARGLELGKLPMTLEVPERVGSNYEVKEQNNSMVATIEDVLDLVNGESNGILVDVRSLAEYDEGTIPESIHYPHTNNLYSDGTFKSEQDIYLNYNDMGLDKDSSVVLYCKSSFRATQTLVLLEEAGFEDVKVYDGAWLEWAESGNPITGFTEPVVLTEQDAS